MEEDQRDVVQTLSVPQMTEQSNGIAIQTGGDGLDAMKETNSHDPETNTNEAANSDVAMCSALTVHSEHEKNPNWVPPPVTHDFSYPSGEEIVPNPKADFSKGLLPKLGKVRNWLKGSKGHGGAPSSSTAPCLPVTSTSAKGGMSPRAYPDLESQLPPNPADLQKVTQRPGASTRLKEIASKRMEGNSVQVEGIVEDVETDGESSSSLEEHTDSPRYSDLAHSVASGDESEDDSQNVAPANMSTY